MGEVGECDELLSVGRYMEEEECEPYLVLPLLLWLLLLLLLIPIIISVANMTGEPIEL